MTNKIINIRAGFATNSSSSHSILYCDSSAIKNIQDSLPNMEEGGFGWGYFVLKSKKEKFRYLLASVPDQKEREDYSRRYSGDFWDHEKDATNIENYYVDHQSIRKFNFEEDVEKYVLNDQIVIVGGNDNSYNYGMNNAYDQVCYAALYKIDRK